jgi:hypothetical protein
VKSYKTARQLIFFPSSFLFLDPASEIGDQEWKKSGSAILQGVRRHILPKHIFTEKLLAVFRIRRIRLFFAIWIHQYEVRIRIQIP